MPSKSHACIIAALVLCATALPSAAATDPSDYANYYPQFVDSKEPLAQLAERDMATWVYKPLSEMLDDRMAKVTDVAFGEDPKQKLDIYHWKDPGRRPVIFYIHGGGWAIGDKNNFGSFSIPASVWLSMGYVVVSVNYRLGLIESSDSTAAGRISSQPVLDKVPPEIRNAHPAQIEDCAQGLKWVMDHIQQYGGDPDRIAITGISAGGHLTALLATDRRVQQKYGLDVQKIKCWIPVSGIYDCSLPGNYSHPWMAAFMKALLDHPGKSDDASPVTHATGQEPPCLIVHGADDWLVPRANSFLLYEKLKAKGAKSAEFELLPGYWHNTPFVRYLEPGDRSAVAMNRFLAAYLPTDANNAENQISSIKLRVNHRTVEHCLTQPYMADDGTVMSGPAFITQNLGASILPEPGGAYKIIRGKKVVVVTADVLGKLGDRLYFPVRLVSEGLGAQVNWIPETKTIIIEI